MNSFLQCILESAPLKIVYIVLLFFRIGIGTLIMIHGYPKIMGGLQLWKELGIMFMAPLGIHCLPTMWGFCAALTQLQRKDEFNVYAYSIMLMLVYGTFLSIGAEPYSLDTWLTR